MSTTMTHPGILEIEQTGNPPRLHYETPDAHCCCFCEKPLGWGERVEELKCDGCNALDCNHRIGQYNDEDFTHERNYCPDCAAERQALRKIY